MSQFSPLLREAAERRIDNDHTSKPNRGGAGLERTQVEFRFYAIAKETKCLDDAAYERLDELRRYFEDYRQGGLYRAKRNPGRGHGRSAREYALHYTKPVEEP